MDLILEASKHWLPLFDEFQRKCELILSLMEGVWRESIGEEHVLLKMKKLKEMVGQGDVAGTGDA